MTFAITSGKGSPSQASFMSATSFIKPAARFPVAESSACQSCIASQSVTPRSLACAVMRSIVVAPIPRGG